MYLRVTLSINGGRLRTYSLDQNEVLIGRAPNCQIRLDNIGISRVHAKLIREDRAVSVVDMDSGNGTFVNGKRIRQVPLGANDELRIGKFIIRTQVIDQVLPARIPIRARPQNPQPPVGDSTVFLRPEEARKILEHVATAPPPVPTAPKVRKRQADQFGWVGFAAGAAVGLLCGWFYWG